MDYGKDWKRVSQIVGRSRREVKDHGARLRNKFKADPKAKRAYLFGILNTPCKRGGR